MPFENTRQLKEDVLFRASEPTSGLSDWDAKVVEYLNRCYRELCTGASAFLPEYVEDWWWLRGNGVLLLEPAFTSGTVTVVQGNATITFDAPVTPDLAGQRLKIDNQADIPLIEVHGGASASATLDTVWTGNSGTYPFKVMRTDYALGASVQALMSPIIIFQAPEVITGMSPERMDLEWPLATLDIGIPQAFSLQNETTVRFSHGGTDDGKSHRLEYRYRRVVADLTDGTDSIPLVPQQWRHILADMALTYVLIDKNDDRSNAVALGARTGLAAMIKDNRRRNVKIDPNAGHIFARPSQRPRPGRRF